MAPAVAKRLSMPPPRPLQLSNSNTEPHSKASPSVSSAPNSPSSAPPPFIRRPSARRQGSIIYLPHNSNPRYDIYSPTSTSRLRRNNSVDSRVATPPVVKEGRKGVGSITESEPSPLTLADKHADLLRFIAQKEAKCMELRSQLAAHEIELAQLKRKWEKIVNKGFERVAGVNGSGPSAPQNSAAQGGPVLGGIREGVQGVGRLLAAGIGEFTVPPINPPTVTNSTRAHSTQQSTSSVTTSRSSVSTSTNSSAADDEFPLDSPEEKVEQNRHILIEEEAPTGNPNLTVINVVDSSNVEEDKAARVLRRRSRDASPFIASTPESKASKMTAGPVSEIPGLGGLPPGTPGWVIGTVGKKWGELQRIETFAKNQKRASLLLSDMSQTLMNAWSSPTASPASASGPAASPSIPSLSPHMPRRSASTCSLLDDDRDLHGCLGVVMTPDLKSTPESAGTRKKLMPLATSTVHTQDDDDDWNW